MPGKSRATTTRTSGVFGCISSRPSYLKRPKCCKICSTYLKCKHCNYKSEVAIKKQKKEAKKILQSLSKQNRRSQHLYDSSQRGTAQWPKALLLAMMEKDIRSEAHRQKRAKDCPFIKGNCGHDFHKHCLEKEPNKCSSCRYRHY